MNLELIKEINSLKDANKSSTEIAEITGLARTSVVLSLRLSKIFNSSHLKEINSLKDQIETLNTSIEKYKTVVLEKDTEFNKLNALIEIDYSKKMVVDKDQILSLENELAKKSHEVDTLKHKLYVKEQYLNNLSFIEKINLLFR